MTEREKDEITDHELARVGESLARLSPEKPPHDLVARTLERISQEYKPVKRVFFLLRPITHPLARLAAAATIILTLSPLTDITVADHLGSNIESRIIGRHATDRIELFVDKLLVRNGAPAYTQEDLDAVIGIPRPVFMPVRQRGSGQTVKNSQI
ncbi:MAG TPA: hypothetical protein VEK08_12855 [Planctomycetota bacterium]|nr:hypothetical protein [Planctomycetota bacterium]